MDSAFLHSAVMTWSFVFLIKAASDCIIHLRHFLWLQPPGLDRIRLHWVLGPVATTEFPSPDEGQISIAVEGDTTGWVGCSFAENPGVMFPADAVVGWMADGDADIRPYRVTVCCHCWHAFNCLCKEMYGAYMHIMSQASCGGRKIATIRDLCWS